MTNKPNTKRAVEVDMSKEDLSKRIAAAKLDLNTALLTGEPTNAARAALRALEDEQRRIDAATAEQQAAQQARAQIEADRIADGASSLAESRAARLSLLSDRFRIPDVRSLAH